MSGTQLWIFVSMFTTVTLVAFGYLFLRLVIRSDLPRQAKLMLGGLLASIVVLMFASRPLFRAIEDPRSSWLATFLQWMSFTLMGFVATLLFLTLVHDLSHLAKRASEWARRRFGGAAVPRSVGAEAVDLGRRHVLGRGAVLGLTGVSAGLTGAGFAQAVAGPGVSRVRVPMARLPAAFEGYRIAQISDLHVGPTIDRAYVERVVEIVNGLDADLVVLTGDLVDGSVAQIGRDFEPLFGLKSRDGLYACTGNHEYYAGALEWIEHMNSKGIRVLMNEHTLIRRAGAAGTSGADAAGSSAAASAAGGDFIVLAGVNDYRASRVIPQHATDPHAAARGAPEGAVKILLAHQPASCFEADKAGFDLQLSGHTHAGQFFPFAFFVKIAHPYIRGLNRHNDRMWVYVNQGTGYWGPPNRLGRPAEITLLELARVEA